MRIRLVTGEDQVACCMCDGWKRLRPLASGVIVDVPPPLLLEALYCSDQLRLILLRGETCQVMRPIPFLSTPSEYAGRSLSKLTTQAFGLPAFLLNHIPGIVLSAEVCRNVR